ncbi:MAG: hypothetical protein ACR2K2_01170 [Mycobacteriales bacterium]
MLLENTVGGADLQRVDRLLPRRQAPDGRAINRVAAVGITGGRTATTYDPNGPVLRDQMGSFLARTLYLFVANGACLPA